MASFQASKKDARELGAFLDILGYCYVNDTDNDTYRFKKVSHYAAEPHSRVLLLDSILSA